MARSMLDEMLGFVDEYLDEGGPLWMLERGVGGPEGDRLASRPVAAPCRHDVDHPRSLARHAVATGPGERAYSDSPRMRRESE